jgi:hypothetical protein
MYDKFPSLNKSWTPIKQKNVEIWIGSTPSHIITRVQFPIQLVVACTKHCAQGLTLDYLAFVPITLTKLGWTYTTLSKICIYICFLHCQKQIFKYIGWLKKKWYDLEHMANMN